MEGTFILAKLRTSPGLQAPPRKKAFWRNIVFNTLLYFVETKNIHTSNMTGIFLQGPTEMWASLVAWRVKNLPATEETV